MPTNVVAYPSVCVLTRFAYLLCEVFQHVSPQLVKGIGQRFVGSQVCGGGERVHALCDAVKSLWQGKPHHHNTDHNNMQTWLHRHPAAHVPMS